ncbi:VOC family protein [Leucobacter chironomi]|uniref:VOC family protein n=1 Tax=Leucobacter chironomi TaxID=491918 RepID=UPI00041BA262|nr:VOC family protein [Leucobacter chironomi]
MTLTLGSLTIDSTDPEPLARWWADQLGGEIVGSFNGEFYIVGYPGSPAALSVQRVAEPTPGKNRMHPDFRAQDPCAEAERLIAAGARAVDEHSDGAIHWHTLEDPEGNRFCVSVAELVR